MQASHKVGAQGGNGRCADGLNLFVVPAAHLIAGEFGELCAAERGDLFDTQFVDLRGGHGGKLRLAIEARQDGTGEGFDLAIASHRSQLFAAEFGRLGRCECADLLGGQHAHLPRGEGPHLGVRQACKLGGGHGSGGIGAQRGNQFAAEVVQLAVVAANGHPDNLAGRDAANLIGRHLVQLCFAEGCQLLVAQGCDLTICATCQGLNL